MSFALPDKMIAIEIKEPGGPEVLVPTERDIPVINKDEVLLKVLAAGVNRPDVMQRKGQYPPPRGASDIPGLEVAGIVVALGEDVRDLAEGEEVCALIAGGGYAEFCAASAQLCLPKPALLTMAQTAAIPETFFTVWDNVFTRGQLQEGETLLIHGGSSGIGTTAIQLAKARGAKVFATAGTDEKCAACESLGADKAINYKEEDFLDAVHQETGGAGVNVILDMVGGDYVAKNLNALSFGGRLIQIAIQKGTKAEIPVHLILVKQLMFTGSTLRARPVIEKAKIALELEKEVWPLLDKKIIEPKIFREFPLKDAAKAHRLMDSSAHIGKIVLTV
ncbi:MAG: NAD(P)H-quinone oxidoreductase [Alphaproteobacteria bacterium]